MTAPSCCCCTAWPAPGGSGIPSWRRSTDAGRDRSSPPTFRATARRPSAPPYSFGGMSAGVAAGLRGDGVEPRWPWSSGTRWAGSPARSRHRVVRRPRRHRRRPVDQGVVDGRGAGRGRGGGGQAGGLVRHVRRRRDPLRQGERAGGAGRPGGPDRTGRGHRGRRTVPPGPRPDHLRRGRARHGGPPSPPARPTSSSAAGASTRWSATSSCWRWTRRPSRSTASATVHMSSHPGRWPTSC